MILGLDAVGGSAGLVLLYAYACHSVIRDFLDRSAAATGTAATSRIRMRCGNRVAENE